MESVLKSAPETFNLIKLLACAISVLIFGKNSKVINANLNVHGNNHMTDIKKGALTFISFLMKLKITFPNNTEQI